MLYFCLRGRYPFPEGTATDIFHLLNRRRPASRPSGAAAQSTSAQDPCRGGGFHHWHSTCYFNYEPTRCPNGPLRWEADHAAPASAYRTGEGVMAEKKRWVRGVKTVST